MRGNPWWILAAVSFGVIMVGLDASVVAIANPRIAVDLNASLSDLQWITDAYLLALASLLIFGGKLGDMFGRRMVFLIGVVGFAVTSVGIGLIGTVGGVIAMRALQGVFGALLMPSTLAIVRNAFPPHKLNTAIGIWGAASGVSVAAGPILGGLLVEHLNWESVFYINVPIAVIAVVIGVAAIVESRGDEERPAGRRRHPDPVRQPVPVRVRPDQGARVGLAGSADGRVPDGRRPADGRRSSSSSATPATRCCRCGCSPTGRCRSAPRRPRSTSSPCSARCSS